MNMSAAIWTATPVPKAFGARRSPVISGCVFYSRQPRSHENNRLVVNMVYPEVGR
jgi:hypothetical protein